MPRHQDVDVLLNELIARLLGGVFLVLVVVVAVALIGFGMVGILRTRRRGLLV